LLVAWVYFVVLSSTTRGEGTRILYPVEFIVACMIAVVVCALANRARLPVFSESPADADIGQSRGGI
jgi:hypothetical protein